MFWKLLALSVAVSVAGCLTGPLRGRFAGFWDWDLTASILGSCRKSEKILEQIAFAGLRGSEGPFRRSNFQKSVAQRS